MIRKYLWIPLFSGVLLLSACNKSGPKVVSPTKGEANQLITVKMVQPKKETILWNIEQPGTIEAFEQTPLVAKFPGYVSKLYVDIDDRVHGPVIDSEGKTTKPGQLLAKISIPEIEDELKLKEAQSNQAKIEIEVARKNLVVAETMIQSAQSKLEEMVSAEKRHRANHERWKSETIRVQDLVTRKVIDSQTAEETLNQSISAQSAWEESKTRILSAKSMVLENQSKRDRDIVEISAAQAKLLASEAEVRRLKSLVSYTEIRAPYDGIITARNVHTGHFLQAGMGNRGEAIFTISRIDPVRIFVEVPELGVDRIKNGGAATVSIQALRHGEVKGTITRTSWSLNTQSRTLKVEIDIPNPDGYIRPGMYAFATIPVEWQNALVIPQTAVFQQDEMNLVYIVEEGKAKRYQLRTGYQGKGKVELLQKRRFQPGETWQPIKGDEQIVLSYKGPIGEGSEVRVEE